MLAAHLVTGIMPVQRKSNGGKSQFILALFGDSSRLPPQAAFAT